MFPISSASLTTPGNVAPVAESAAVAPVRSDLASAAGSATDAPAAAAVSVDLSPVANFLLTVSQSQEQLSQLQTANAEPRQAAASLNDATQNVVDAFNLLPSVDFNQTQPQGPSLLNKLVQSLQQQTLASGAPQAQQTAAQNLARIGVTLQAPLLSDATGGLSLDNEVLRAAFHTSRQATTQTLQNTLSTFSELATRFAEQLSSAGTSALEALAARQQAPLTPADAAANARLEQARMELDLLAHNADAGAPVQAAAAAANAADTAAAQQATAVHNASAAQDAVARTQAAQSAAQVAAVQAGTQQNDPLRANPALASAIAAYNINETSGAHSHAAPAASSAIPRVPAVEPAARARAIGNAP